MFTQSRQTLQSQSKIQEKLLRARQGNNDEVGAQIGIGQEEPSKYLERLGKMITEKQDILNKSSINMQNSLNSLEENINLMKHKIVSLETTQTTLEKEIQNNETELTNTNDQTQSNKQLLENKLEQLTKERDIVIKERDQQLEEISNLERRVESLENEWNKSKLDLLDRLKQFEQQELTPYLTQVEDLIQTTNARIDASNIRLIKHLEGKMDFGQSDFFTDLTNRKREIIDDSNLFGGNNISINNEENEENDEENEDGDIDDEENEENEENDEENEDGDIDDEENDEENEDGDIDDGENEDDDDDDFDIDEDTDSSTTDDDFD